LTRFDRGGKETKDFGRSRKTKQQRRRKKEKGKEMGEVTGAKPVSQRIDQKEKRSRDRNISTAGRKNGGKK